MVSLISIWYMLQLVQAQFSSLQNKIKSEVEMNELVFSVEHYLGMAVNLTKSPPLVTSTFDFNSSEGKIAEYKLTDVWQLPVNRGDSGEIDTIAYFLRDNLYSNYPPAPTKPAAAVRFLPTGIFFQRPTIQKYGVLYVNLPRSTDTQMIPSTADYFFEGLVDFEVTNVTAFPFQKTGAGASTKNMVFSVTFVVTQRHFLPSVHNQPLIWCPPHRMNFAQCAGSRPYFDMTKTFTVKIRNNVIAESSTQRKRGPIDPLTGKQTYVPLEERVFGNIYFLRPSYPPGVLKR